MKIYKKPREIKISCGFSFVKLFHFEKFFHINIRLFQDCAQCAFGHISGVVWNGDESFRGGVKPDFVTSCIRYRLPADS